MTATVTSNHGVGHLWHNGETKHTWYVVNPITEKQRFKILFNDEGRGMKIGAAGLLLLVPMSAFAEVFVGGQAGIASVNDFCEGSGDFTGAGISVNCDDEAGTFVGLIGYQVNPNISIEAFAGYLGEISANITDGSETASIEIDGTTIGVNLTAYWPLSPRFSLIGQAGALRWNLDANVKITDGIDTLEGTATDKGTDPFFGFGASFQASERLTLRLLYQRFLDVSDSDIDVLSVGFTIR